MTPYDIENNRHVTTRSARSILVVYWRQMAVNRVVVWRLTSVSGSWCALGGAESNFETQFKKSAAFKQTRHSKASCRNMATHFASPSHAISPYNSPTHHMTWQTQLSSSYNSLSSMKRSFILFGLLDSWLSTGLPNVSYVASYSISIYWLARAVAATS